MCVDFREMAVCALISGKWRCAWEMPVCLGNGGVPGKWRCAWEMEVCLGNGGVPGNILRAARGRRIRVVRSATKMPKRVSTFFLDPELTLTTLTLTTVT